MPSLRQNYHHFFPKVKRKDSVSVSANVKTTLKLLLALVSATLLWLMTYAPLWYTLYSRSHRSMLKHKLFIPTHLLSSAYGLTFALVLLFVLNTDTTKAAIAFRLSLCYALYYGLTLVVVVEDYSHREANDSQIHSVGENNGFCRLFGAFQCGLYLLHLLLEFAMYPSVLIIVTSAMLWTEEWCRGQGKGQLDSPQFTKRRTYMSETRVKAKPWKRTDFAKSSVATTAQSKKPHFQKVMGMLAPQTHDVFSVGKRLGTARGEEEKPEVNFRSGTLPLNLLTIATMDLGPLSLEVPSMHPTEIELAPKAETETDTTTCEQIITSAITDLLQVDTTSEEPKMLSPPPILTPTVPITEEKIGSSLPSVLVSDANSSKRDSEAEVKVEYKNGVDEKMEAEKKAVGIYRVSLILYFIVFAFAMIVWVQFSALTPTYINRNYTFVLEAFYLSCFILKRPLCLLSSAVDSARIQLPHSGATEDDISLEVLNEWLCSVVYYTFVRVRALMRGGTHGGVEALLQATAVHISFEGFASLLQPQSWYFVFMKKFRVNTVHIWDGTLQKQTDATDSRADRSASLSASQPTEVADVCCCVRLWHHLLRTVFGGYMGNFKRNSHYNQWRNRCFIDSTMRLVISILTSAVCWVQAFVVYKTDYHYGTPGHSESFKAKQLIKALKFLSTQVVIDMVLFAGIFGWFKHKFHSNGFTPFVTLMKRCKNPRYLFVLCVSFCCYVQVSMFY